MKLAALEAMWHTEEAPAGLTAIGFPSLEDRKTHYEVKIPYVLGLIATRSVDKPVEGILNLVAIAEDRIERGVVAYDALEKIKADPTDMAARGQFETVRNDLGYGLLLRRYVEDPRLATPEQIQLAAWSTVPNVPVMFWTFRVMAGIGFLMIGLFATAFILCTLRKHETRWFLRLAVLAIRLDSGRGRPPALGRGRRPADLPGRIQPDGDAAVDDDHWLHRALRRPGRDRSGPDPQGHQEGPLPRTGSPGRVGGRRRTGRGLTLQIKDNRRWNFLSTSPRFA